MAAEPHVRAGGRRFVVGALSIPDWEHTGAAVVVAHWIYALAKQGARDTWRVGVAA